MKGNLLEVCLEVTDSCPMNCIYCSSINDISPESTMNLREIKRVIDDMSQLGAQILEISGGEPLLHRDLYEIINHARSHKLETRLYTSGISLSSSGEMTEITGLVADQLRDSGLVKVIFNLQGATAEAHEELNRIPGSFEKIINSITNMKSKDFWVGVHFVAMKPNYQGVAQVVKLCADLDLDEIAILRFVPQGRGLMNREKLELSEPEFIDLLTSITELRKRFSNRLRIGSPLNFCYILDKDAKPINCAAGVSTCTILPNGDVVPCPAFKQNQTYVAGNVKENSFIDIWNKSPIFKHCREFRPEKLRGVCRNCEYLSWCQGRCAAQRVLAWGYLYHGPDPNCPISYYGKSSIEDFRFALGETSPLSAYHTEYSP